MRIKKRNLNREENIEEKQDISVNFIRQILQKVPLSFFFTDNKVGGDNLGYRYDMGNYSPQQQAIVRQRDEEEKRRREEAERQKVKCERSPRNGDYEGVYFTKNGEYLLELRVSGTALVNAPCNLKDIDIKEWLCKTGRLYLDKVKKFEIVTILSHDVENQKIITEWESLRRENLPEQFDS